MKFLILFSCALAVISAQHQPYYGPQHIPVIGPNGVPLDTPANQQATASHLAALAAAGSRGGQYSPGPGQYSPYAAPSDQYSGKPWRQTPPAYQTTNHIPRVAANGTPLDTPEVEAAKANHFAAYGQAHAALAQAAPGPAYGGHYRKRRSLYSGPWAYNSVVPAIGPNGVPLDTPEVQHAKAAHFAAYAEAASRGGHLALGSAPALSYGYSAFPQHIPVIDGNGVPVDTPEVQHARAAHYAALNEAAGRAGPGHYGDSWGYGAPLIAAGSSLIGHGGAPVDTPEVQAAKAAHFAAHAAVRGHY